MSELQPNNATPKLARDKVPFGQKAAFGAGHLVNNLFPGALGVFSFFLLTAFGMDPFLAGILGGLPRIYDAIIDPIIGHISDNTISRWGRRRPFIFVGAILSGLFFIILWQLDPNDSQSYNFWYFLIFSLVFLTGNALFATPLIGLGYEMTSDYKERTRLMGFSQTIGQIAWMIVPWFWVVIADPTIFKTQAEGVHKLSVIVGLICLVLGILPALFCKEMDQTNLENRSNKNKNVFSELLSLFKSIGLISKNKSFMKLCAATFLVFNGFQMVASFSYFIIVFYLFKGDYGLAGTWPAWFSTISAVFTAFLIIPITYSPFSVTEILTSFVLCHLVFSYFLTIAFSSSHVIKGTRFIMYDKDGNLPYSFYKHQLITSFDFYPENKFVSFLPSFDIFLPSFGIFNLNLSN